MRSGRAAAVAAVLLGIVATGCKHPLAIEGEGDIVERNGVAQGCTLEDFQAGAASCTVEVLPPDTYVASYEAVPRPGWVFTGWGGVGCGEVTPEGYCNFKVSKAAVLVFNTKHPGFTSQPTVAIFKRPEEAASDIFADQVAEPVLSERCLICHYEGGISGHTRLVFDPVPSATQNPHNVEVFREFIGTVPDGKETILNKVRGGLSHGGGSVFSAGSEEFAAMSFFLDLLEGTADISDAPEVETFWSGITMADGRATLRRAAMIMGGELPTAADFDNAAASEAGLRQELRELMQGNGFHEFLVEGANDRLLTDRWISYELYNQIAFNFPGVLEAAYPRLEAEGLAGGNATEEWQAYLRQINYGGARAPTELIAHVVENDLPYTEILTADYVMVNPYLAQAYGSNTTFNDPDDPTEFHPGRLENYLRQGNGDDDIQIECIDPMDLVCRYLGGGLATDYPHAGVLNSHAFLARYPSTATNRNRARSRWTYYHFLGVDIEKSANRTSDPDALADLDNPTLKNPNCTVCHSFMDPVAGAFQNYGDQGLFKDQPGGLDSLPESYKRGDEGVFNPASRIVLVYDGADGRDWYAWDTFVNGLFSETPVIDGCCPEVDLLGKSGNIRATVRGDRLQGFRDGRLVIDSRLDPSLDAVLLESGGIGLYAWKSGEKRFDRIRVWDESGASPRLVFEDDFSRRTQGLWNEAYGDWSIENGHYVIRGEGLSQLQLDVAGIESLRDVTVELSVIGAIPGTGIWLRALPVPDAESYHAGDTWYRDMRVPGFEGRQAPNPDNSLQWLARQIVADPRFASATVKFWWQSLMGAEPLEAPSDPGDFGFAEDQAAYNAQQAAISELAKGFAAGFGDGSAFDLKDLLVEMAMTPWFRAAASESALDDSDVLRLQAAGIPRLLTASQLMRKTRTLTGLTWGESESYLSPYIKRSQLFFNRLNYGGIDSDGVTRRNYELTAVMADVAIANALNLACPAVALDFARPDVDRRLFAGISPEDTPDTASGVLRNKLVELHWLMLGQSVSPDSAEVQHSYNLLESIYRDRLARNAAEALHDEAIVCDGEEIWQLPWEDWAPDPTHMKASWRAVMAYLMTHYRYLHE